MKKAERIAELERENGLLRRHIRSMRESARLGGVITVEQLDAMVRQNVDRSASPTHPNCMIGRKG